MRKPRSEQCSVRTQPPLLVLKMEKGPRGKECGEPLEARKGREMTFLLGAS